MKGDLDIFKLKKLACSFRLASTYSPNYSRQEAISAFVSNHYTFSTTQVFTASLLFYL